MKETTPQEHLRIGLIATDPLRVLGLQTIFAEDGQTEVVPLSVPGALDASGVSVIVTVDNTAVPASVVDQVWERLNAKIHLPRERLVVCSSHTHCAQCVAGGIENMFGAPLPADQQRRIDRYTRELTDELEKVALAAIADSKPSSPKRR